MWDESEEAKMSIVLMTPEGKKVVVNRSTDEQLYDSPNNPPNTGTRYTAGVDLYAHKARSGTWYYYTYAWSMWQGHEDEFTLVTEDEAKGFILEKAAEAGHGAMNTGEMEICEKHFPGVFDEDA